MPKNEARLNRVNEELKRRLAVYLLLSLKTQK